jgi:hypothetical protein
MNRTFRIVEVVKIFNTYEMSVPSDKIENMDEIARLDYVENLFYNLVASQQEICLVEEESSEAEIEMIEEVK